MTATTTPPTVATESDGLDAIMGSLTHFATNAISVTELQDHLERSTITLHPIRSSLVEADRIRHTEASDVSQ